MTESTRPLDHSEWMRIFADAEKIITSTFHGVVFSIKMQRPFPGMSRIPGAQPSFFASEQLLYLSSTGAWEPGADS